MQTQTNPPIPETAHTGNPQRVSRRQMTVLFCDLVGSTSLADQLDPEDLLDALSAYHAVVKQVAARFNGFIARITGDGVDLYFGYPVAGEDDAVHALYAGLAIVEELGNLARSGKIDPPLSVRVGIATGLVAVSTRDSVSIAGTTPNLAARVQSVIEPGQVGVAPSTRRIAGPQFVYEDRGAFELKGFEGPVRISVVTGAQSLTSRSAWRTRENATPIVGREAEIDTLLACWKRASGGSCVGVLVTGEAGLGKSRITTALDQQLEFEVHTTIRLQCSPFHTNTALHPFAQHLAEAAGFSRHDSALIRLDKLEAQLAIAGLESGRDICLLAALLDIDFAHRYPPLALPPPLQLQLTKEVLSRYFAGLASTRIPTPGRDQGGSGPPMLAGSGPLLLTFEDLHWVDPTSLEVIDLILANAPSARILLLMTARPEFAPPFDPAHPLTPLPIARLDPAAARLVARNLAAEMALPESAIETIVAKTDGVPLYIEEMTRMVMDARSARSQAGADAPLEIPDTLLDLLMERLDRLGSAKWLAQVGSVLGREFPKDLLSAVAELEPAAFDEALHTMLASGLVLPADSTGTRFIFKHALVEDTAYASILLKTRAALHSRAADVLVRDHAAAIERNPEVAARHLARARRQLESSRYWLASGRQALGRGAPREAAAHLKDGVAVLAEVPPSQERSESELALLSMLGPTTMVLMGPGSLQFGGVQKRAYELCNQLPGAPRRFPITYGLCLFHWGRAELAEAYKLSRELLAAADAAPDSDEQVMAANNMSGMITFHQGDPRTARAHLERTVARYKAERDAVLYPVYLMDFGVFGRFYLALATFVTGDADAARDHARDALELAGRLNQPHTLGFSLLANFNIATLRDEPAVARQFAEQCIEFSSQQGFPEFVAMARIVRGWATARDGHHEAGIGDIKEGIELWKATGFENWQPWFACLLAEGLVLAGKADEALAEIDHQLNRIQANGENQFRSVLLAEKAAILAAKPDGSGPARTLFDEAQALAEAQGAQAWSRRIASKRQAALGATS
jgi:class 3 adenylate cyclase/predicted ATPase